MRFYNAATVYVWNTGTRTSMNALRWPTLACPHWQSRRSMLTPMTSSSVALVVKSFPRGLPGQYAVSKNTIVKNPFGGSSLTDYVAVAAASTTLQDGFWPTYAINAGVQFDMYVNMDRSHTSRQDGTQRKRTKTDNCPCHASWGPSPKSQLQRWNTDTVHSQMTTRSHQPFAPSWDKSTTVLTLGRSFGRWSYVSAYSLQLRPRTISTTFYIIPNNYSRTSSWFCKRTRSTMCYNGGVAIRLSWWCCLPEWMGRQSQRQERKSDPGPASTTDWCPRPTGSQVGTTYLLQGSFGGTFLLRHQTGTRFPIMGEQNWNPPGACPDRSVSRHNFWLTSGGSHKPQHSKALVESRIRGYYHSCGLRTSMQHVERIEVACPSGWWWWTTACAVFGLLLRSCELESAGSVASGIGKCPTILLPGLCLCFGYHSTSLCPWTPWHPRQRDTNPDDLDDRGICGTTQNTWSWNPTYSPRSFWSDITKTYPPLYYRWASVWYLLSQVWYVPDAAAFEDAKARETIRYCSFEGIPSSFVGCYGGVCFGLAEARAPLFWPWSSTGANTWVPGIGWAFPGRLQWASRYRCWHQRFWNLCQLDANRCANIARNRKKKKSSWVVEIFIWGRPVTSKHIENLLDLLDLGGGRGEGVY